MNCLSVENLSVEFSTEHGKVKVLRDINLVVDENESIGIVGESGSGKSVTSLVIMRLFAENAKITTGHIYFKNENLLGLSEKKIQSIRGSKISMIFQDPMSSLNPCYTVGYQIQETLQTHQDITKTEAQEIAKRLLEQVGIPDSEKRLKSFPHELSGGMNQRIMIAMSIACNPDLLIADEPTTALDVTVQAQILSLLQKIRKTEKRSMILISHDLGLISQQTDRVYVMYAGEIVEEGQTNEVLKNPKHPYTKGLLNCLPAKHTHHDHLFKLPSIPGVVPDLSKRTKGCQFAPRCNQAVPICSEEKIPYVKTSSRGVRCLFPDGDINVES